tara:strand:+ start:508 stop:951 length:444 start_codon:yes stop_codon:yes gene_type:complete
MDNRFKFNIEFDKNFHIIVEKPEEDIPEPINEEYSIIELENNEENSSGENIIELDNDLQEEITEIKQIPQNKIHNMDEDKTNDKLLNNVNFTLDQNLKDKESLLNNLESKFCDILDQNLIIDHIDSVIDSQISCKIDQIKDFKNYKI